MFNFLKKNIDDKKIDMISLNEIIKLTCAILKIGLILAIILTILVASHLLQTWGIIIFIKSIIKILSPFFIGLIIAWLLTPIVNFLKTKKINRILGAIMTYTVFLVAIYLVIYSIVPLLIREINDFFLTVPKVLTSISTFIDSIFANFDSAVYNVDTLKVDLYKSIETSVTNYTTALPNNIIIVTKQLFSYIWVFLIGLVIGLYLLFDFDKSVNNLVGFIPIKIRNNYKEVAKKIDVSLKNFVYGTLILSSIIFVVCALSFWIAGLSSPVLFALFCAITNLIPYFGPYIGAIPAVIVGYATGPVTGTIVLLVICVLQFFEGNIIHPLVMSKTMKLHPVTIIVGLLIFGYFFGIVGMMFATPIISIIKIFWQFFNKKYSLVDMYSDKINRKGKKGVENGSKL
ncbi:MAG: AI-2E family transporter [bacterium]|nr:AI-2E family transporter [bacterium]